VRHGARLGAAGIADQQVNRQGGYARSFDFGASQPGFGLADEQRNLVTAGSGIFGGSRRRAGLLLLLQQIENHQNDEGDQRDGKNDVEGRHG
jgi:hypothetical protein